MRKPDGPMKALAEKKKSTVRVALTNDSIQFSRPKLNYKPKKTV